MTTPHPDSRSRRAPRTSSEAAVQPARTAVAMPFPRLRAAFLLLTLFAVLLAAIGMARVVRAQESVVLIFPAVEGTVNAALSDGTGGWYLGGEFESVGGVARHNLAHLRADQ